MKNLTFSILNLCIKRAAFICTLLFFATVYSGQAQQGCFPVEFGNPFFSPGPTSNLHIAAGGDGSAMAVFRNNNLSPSGLTVMQTTGAGWILYDQPNFTPGSAEDPRIAIHPSLNLPYVVFRDEDQGGKISVMRWFHGSGWEYVGSPGISDSPAQSPDIAFNQWTGELFITYSEPEIMCKKFDGTAWSDFGIDGAAGTVYNDATAKEPRIAVWRQTGNIYISFKADFPGSGVKGVVMTAGGSNQSFWSPYANSAFTPGEPFFTSLDVNQETGQVYYAFSDASENFRPAVMTVTLSTWEFLGDGFAAPSASLGNSVKIQPESGVPYLAIYNSNNSGRPEMKRWFGSEWITAAVLPADYGNSTSLSIAFEPNSNEAFLGFSNDGSIGGPNSMRPTVFRFPCSDTPIYTDPVAYCDTLNETEYDFLVKIPYTGFEGPLDGGLSTGSGGNCNNTPENIGDDPTQQYNGTVIYGYYSDECWNIELPGGGWFGGPPPVCNNYGQDCSDGLPLSCGETVYPYFSYAYTYDLPYSESSTCSEDVGVPVWYSFTAENDAEYTFTLEGAQIIAEIYDGCDSSEPIYCGFTGYEGDCFSSIFGNETFELYLVAGNYNIKIIGNCDFPELSVSCGAPLISNNECGNASFLGCDQSYTYDESMGNSTLSNVPLPFVCPSIAPPETFYDQWFTVESDGAAFDHILAYGVQVGLALYDGSCETPELIAAECASTDFEGYVYLSLPEGEAGTYYLRAISFSNVSFPAQFDLYSMCTPPWIDCEISLHAPTIGSCTLENGGVEIGISGQVSAELGDGTELIIEITTDEGLFWGAAETSGGFFQTNEIIFGSTLISVSAFPSVSILNCNAVFNDPKDLPGSPCLDCLGVPHGPAMPGTPCNDGNPNTIHTFYTFECDCIGLQVECQVAGGELTAEGNLNPCPGLGESGFVQLHVSGNLGSSRFGIINDANDIVASNTSGLFNLNNFPPGNYRLGHLSYGPNFNLAALNNISQLEGCYDYSNLISVKSSVPDGGSLTANGPTTVCQGSNDAANISFTLTGSSGSNTRWAVLDQDATEIMALSTSGNFNWGSSPPGTYRVVHAAYNDGISLSQVDPQNVTGCIDRSNSVIIKVNNCASATLTSSPNPTTGNSTALFSLPLSQPALLEVYDLTGRCLAQIFKADATEAEQYSVHFDGSALPNGVYFYRLSTEDEVLTSKFIVAR